MSCLVRKAEIRNKRQKNRGRSLERPLFLASPWLSADDDCGIALGNCTAVGAGVADPCSWRATDHNGTGASDNAVRSTGAYCRIAYTGSGKTSNEDGTASTHDRTTYVRGRGRTNSRTCVKMTYRCSGRHTDSCLKVIQHNLLIFACKTKTLWKSDFQGYGKFGRSENNIF